MSLFSYSIILPTFVLVGDRVVFALGPMYGVRRAAEWARALLFCTKACMSTWFLSCMFANSLALFEDGVTGICEFDFAD